MAYKVKCTNCFYERNATEDYCSICWNNISYKETYEDYDKLIFDKINIWWEYNYF